MAVARRRTHSISDEERAQLKNELLGELAAAFSDSNPETVLESMVAAGGVEPLGWSDLESMSEAQVNAAWGRISAALESGELRPPHPAQAVPDEQPESESPPPPRATGAQISGYNSTGADEPITWASLNNMSVEDHIRRRDEINAFLEGGGR